MLLTISTTLRIYAESSILQQVDYNANNYMSGILGEKDITVVLVHGYKDSSNGGIKTLKEALDKNGYDCILPDLAPNDASAGLIPLALQLKDNIDRHTQHKPLVIIGVSMGALVSRYYMQELGGHQKTAAFFSICGPHRGTLLALFFKNAGIRQMRPFSGFMRSLHSSLAKISHIPTVCYWKCFDKVIIPWSSSRIGIGENVRIKSRLHRTVVREQQLHSDILKRLEKLTCQH